VYRRAFICAAGGGGRRADISSSGTSATTITIRDCLTQKTKTLMLMMVLRAAADL